MFLSRVEIDKYNRKALKDLSHLGCYHGWIEDSFLEDRAKPKEERSRKLWRIDCLKGKYYLLILSETKPDIGSLEKYGVKGSMQIKSYDKFLSNIKEGMRARFKINLNTTKSISEKIKSGKRGRVVPVPIEELNEFFISKAEKNGFKVERDEFGITERNSQLFKKNSDDKTEKANLHLVGAVYEGILSVTDLDKFKNALLNGIGRKKAYGFGMLSIIPYNE